jgi:tRNA A-37 threonylcarbamoyl transferase component Bud32
LGTKDDERGATSMSGSPTGSDTYIGTALGGRYRLDAEIGRGGMSTVYKAFDTVLERPVAVKVMHRELATESDQHERFRREARAVAQLSHPHIVTVIDFDDGDSGNGGPYIVFEHVEGETLKSLIRREGALESTEALAYALELARALAAAHEHMIVHRDVKPQNVLLGNEGTAKITDFGIARSLRDQGLTMDGRVLGTTDYVSPEQALGQPVTVQSDVYSLGVVLYEMLTGEVPFRGETPVAVAMRHVREEVPDVQMRRPELSAATAAVLDRATAKDLAERYPDMESMISDLEEALAIEAARTGYAGGEVTSVLRTLPAPARRRLPWRMRHPLRWVTSIGLVGVAVAAVLIFALGHTKRGTGTPPEVHGRGGLQPVGLAQNAAHGYNPFGTEEEDEAQIGNLVDGDAGTDWSTEEYREDTLAPKPGTGFYVDAAPGVAARAVVVQTPSPGFEMAIYAAHKFDGSLPFGERTPLTKRGWVRLAAPVPIISPTKIALATNGLSYRYYLFWITKLPAERPSAQVSEVTLLR